MNFNNQGRRILRQNSVNVNMMSSGSSTTGNLNNMPQIVHTAHNLHGLLQQQLSAGNLTPTTTSASSTSNVLGTSVAFMPTNTQFAAHIPATQLPPPSLIIDNAPVSLISEISDIMRSCGDSDQPRLDSVKLVEHVLQQQLRGMFHEASAIAMNRKGVACPALADFEFLMRNNPVKIARMRKHLKEMRILKRFLSIRTGRPQDYVEDLERTESDEELAIEVPELYDEERTRRLFRADRISQILTGQQYLDFNEARKTSFYCRHGEKIKNKFRSFLNFPKDMRIPTTTMNILAYFAYETIAVIVDYAILTRLNSENRKTEPYSRVTSTGASASMLHICPEVTQGRGMEVVRPITVKEINEGMRRFHHMTTKRIGYYRSICDNQFKRSFLAL